MASSFSCCGTTDRRSAASGTTSESLGNSTSTESEIGSSTGRAGRDNDDRRKLVGGLGNLLDEEPRPVSAPQRRWRQRQRSHRACAPHVLINVRSSGRRRRHRSTSQGRRYVVSDILYKNITRYCSGLPVSLFPANMPQSSPHRQTKLSTSNARPKCPPTNWTLSHCKPLGSIQPPARRTTARR